MFDTMSTQRYISSRPTSSYQDEWSSRQYERQGRSRSQQTFSSSSSQTRRRPRSADTRPQNKFSRALGRAPGCFNLFYPMEIRNEPETIFPPELPKVEVFHNTDARQPEHYNQRNMRHSLSPSRRRTDMPSDPHHKQLPVYDQEFVKNSLIMYGNMDQQSQGTGMSQQELLARRKRDTNASKRKSKGKSNDRIVYMPPTLFPPHDNTRQTSTYINSSNIPQDHQRDGSYPSTAQQITDPTSKPKEGGPRFSMVSASRSEARQDGK